MTRSAASRSTPFSSVGARCARSRLRISTAAQSGVRPYQSARLDIGAVVDQQLRHGELAVGDRHERAA